MTRTEADRRMGGLYSCRIRSGTTLGNQQVEYPVVIDRRRISLGRYGRILVKFDPIRIRQKPDSDPPNISGSATLVKHLQEGCNGRIFIPYQNWIRIHTFKQKKIRIRPTYPALDPQLYCNIFREKITGGSV